jgi:TolA-binding protein
MRLWSNKTNKQVEFTNEAADETLLAAVDNELAKQPHKTFSDLCKEALWQLLYVPESVRPCSDKLSQLESQITQLQGQLASLEQRIAAKEASRLDTLESHLQQLSLQVGQLATAIDSGGFSAPRSQPQPPEEETAPLPPPQEVDPLLSRLGSLLDDF